MTYFKETKRYVYLFALSLLMCAGLVAQNNGSIRGVVTDPSGAVVPNAVIAVKGKGGEFHAKTDGSGKYAVGNLTSGKYVVAIGAKGFAVSKNPDFEVAGNSILDVQLVIKGDAQIVNVEDEVNAVTTDPASNGTALVLGQKELAALSDDPDELSNELQAMAGPGGGPNGGQIYVDGFTGGNMPPKSSIREVRINSNPYSTEYDRPGFGRIEIFTKPGSDKIRGQAFFQFNDQYFNSRSPLLTSGTRAPYGNKVEGFNITGPIKANKASFGFDFERRDITENAFVNATTIDSSLKPLSVNQSVVTPQTRTNFSPRLDYTINQKNTLVVRYQFTRIGLDDTGVGGYNLASQGYSTTEGENTIQATETAVISPTMINESRFQFMHTTVSDQAKSSLPTINVAGAFTDGGVSVGNSGNTSNKVEFTNATTITYGTHTYKLGGRIRQTFDNDTSLNGFNGTYVFLGRQGPVLDANNQPTGQLETLTALDSYQRTLLGEQLGLTAAQIRLLGGGASQFTLSSGTALTAIHQFDAGLFFNDDWRMKPNLTLSYGLRYETQTNIGDYSDWAPRVGLAWGIGGTANKTAKTVLRAGAGVFYDRVADTLSLAAERYNGLTQQSYFIQNPDFYPNKPSLSALAGSGLPQQYKPLYLGIEAPRTYQVSIGLERQINKYVRLSGQYVESRGVHLSNSRNINVPVNGIYPFGDAALRILSESSGLSRTHQLFFSPNVNYKKMFLFGFYSYSHGKDNNEGSPADPNNLKAEWGPSSFADVRHRFVLGTSVPLPLKVSVSPFIVVSSGTPYNITTGQDTNFDGYTSERPALDTSLSAAACSGKTLVYESGFGCFNLSPTSGTQIGRNYGRGPASFTVNMRVSRTWSFGRKGESGQRDNNGPPPGMGGVRGGGGPPGGGGGPPGGPGGGGPPPGMFGGATSGKKYNLTLTASARNLFNHANYATPSGDLSSPFFGQYTSLASGFGPMGGASTFNRKIDLQLRFQF
jgi:hypothetical protein